MYPTKVICFFLNVIEKNKGKYMEWLQQSKLVIVKPKHNVNDYEHLLYHLWVCRLEATFSFWVLNYHKIVDPKNQNKKSSAIHTKDFCGEKKRKRKSCQSHQILRNFFLKSPYLEISIKSLNT